MKLYHNITDALILSLKLYHKLVQGLLLHHSKKVHWNILNEMFFQMVCLVLIAGIQLNIFVWYIILVNCCICSIKCVVSVFVCDLAIITTMMDRPPAPSPGYRFLEAPSGRDCYTRTVRRGTLVPGGCYHELWTYSLCVVHIFSPLWFYFRSEGGEMGGGIL